MKQETFIEMIGIFDNVCYSGGARGADRLFGLYAAGINHTVIHFSFENHKHAVDEKDIIRVSSSLLSSPDVLSKLKNTSRVLQRKVPYVGSYVYNLLARNYYQIINTDRVYTIGKLISPTQLDGGTAWAVQMYIDSSNEAEIYHFDRGDKNTYKYNNISGEFEEVDFVPTPHGKWTGIGSRDATENDMELFKQRFTNVIQ